MDIKGKNVLVTGGALRIGRAVCEAFAQAGANVMIHCGRSLSEAKALQLKLNAAKVIQQDLAEDGAAFRIFDQAGRVDILINNASVFINKAANEESPELAERQMRINYDVPRQLMELFRGQGLTEGCIINFLDQAVVDARENSGSYLRSKKALADFTLSAAGLWAPAIRVNGIAPGPVLPPPDMKSSTMEKTLKSVPLRRPVAMRDITDSCLFLVRNDSVTGNILFVDCGQHLR